jgi:hypothetical protein
VATRPGVIRRVVADFCDWLSQLFDPSRWTPVPDAEVSTTPVEIPTPISVDPGPVDPFEADPLVDEVRTVVERARRIVASGEYKRHWAYVRLEKQHPNRSKDIGLLIEQIVRGDR